MFGVMVIPKYLQFLKSLNFSLNNTGRFNESLFNEAYLDTLTSWSDDESLCVCPLGTDNSRSALCSKNEDMTCVGNAIDKPGVTVDTGSRDQRSVGKRHGEDVRERLRHIRHRRDLAATDRNLVRVIILQITHSVYLICSLKCF